MCQFHLHLHPKCTSVFQLLQAMSTGAAVGRRTSLEKKKAKERDSDHISSEGDRAEWVVGAKWGGGVDLGCTEVNGWLN